MEQQEAVRITDNRGKKKMTEPEELHNHTHAEPEPTVPPMPVRRSVAACFGVILELDGTVTATGDITALAEVQPQRAATFHDMYAATSHIQKDITTEETAMRVLNGLQQLQQQAQAAMEQARIQQQMTGIDLSRM